MSTASAAPAIISQPSPTQRFPGLSAKATLSPSRILQDTAGVIAPWRNPPPDPQELKDSPAISDAMMERLLTKMRVISVNSSEVKILEGVVDDRYQHLLNLRELHHARQADVQLKEKQNGFVQAYEQKLEILDAPHQSHLNIIQLRLKILAALDHESLSGKITDEAIDAILAEDSGPFEALRNNVMAKQAQDWPERPEVPSVLTDHAGTSSTTHSGSGLAEIQHLGEHGLWFPSEVHLPSTDYVSALPTGSDKLGVQPSQQPKPKKVKSKKPMVLKEGGPITAHKLYAAKYLPLHPGITTGEYSEVWKAVPAEVKHEFANKAKEMKRLKNAPLDGASAGTSSQA